MNASRGVGRVDRRDILAGERINENVGASPRRADDRRISYLLPALWAQLHDASPLATRSSARESSEPNNRGGSGYGR
jgi:hypothetical protein